MSWRYAASLHGVEVDALGGRPRRRDPMRRRRDARPNARCAARTRRSRIASRRVVDPLAVVGEEAARRRWPRRGRGCRAPVRTSPRAAASSASSTAATSCSMSTRAVGGQQQLVRAGGRGHDRRAVEAGLGEQAAEPGDHRAQRCRPRLGQLLAPTAARRAPRVGPRGAVRTPGRRGRAGPGGRRTARRAGVAVGLDLDAPAHPHASARPKSPERGLASLWGGASRPQTPGKGPSVPSPARNGQRRATMITARRELKRRIAGPPSHSPSRRLLGR